MVDLVVGMTLAAVIAGVAMFGIGPAAESYRLDAAVEQISHEIARVRMQAVGQNARVRLRFASGSTYVVERSTDGQSYEPTSEPRALPSGVVVVGGTSVSVDFDRQGISSTRAVVTVQNSAGTKVLETNPFGRVKIS